MNRDGSLHKARELMSGQPKPYPRLKITLKQWMIFLAVLALFNYLAVLMVRQIPVDRFTEKQVRLRTVVAFLVTNGFVIGYGLLFLVARWLSKVYRHKRGLPDPSRRTVVWTNVWGLLFALCIMLTNFAVQSYRTGHVGLTVGLAVAACLCVGLLRWATAKLNATKKPQSVDEAQDIASPLPEGATRGDGPS